jgi:hypothetical protein
VAVDGKFGPELKKVVNALQRKLGMRETGKVTGALMKALRHAEILAPCANGAKRSREMDEVDELIRAVGLADEDELVEDEDDEEPAPALSRCCPSEHTFDREWPLDDIVRTSTATTWRPSTGPPSTRSSPAASVASAASTTTA